MANDVRITVSAVDQASPTFKNIAQTAIGVFAGNIMQDAIQGFVSGFKSMVNEAIEAEDYQAKLNQVLKATGGIAGITAKEANDLATAFSQVTKFSEESVLGAETVLLRFKSIGKDVFPQATDITLDLAEALGIDASSAATMLGKALETPGEGMLRLKAAGVALDDETIKMIQSMADAGNMAGAQKMILDALTTSVGGMAEAAGTTASGKFEIMKNSLLEVAEAIGIQLLPLITNLLSGILAFIQSEQFTAWLNGLIGVLGNVIAFIQANWQPILAAALAGIVALIVTVVIPAFIAWAGTAITAAAATIAAIAPIALPILAIMAAVGLLVAAWKNDWGGIRTTLTDLWNNTLLPIFTSLKLWFTETLPVAIKGVKTFVDTYLIAPFNNLATTLTGGVTSALDWIKGKFDGIKSFFSSFTLPDWLTPGSPTPFELGLRGIASALEDINGISMPMIFGGRNGQMAGTNITNNFNYKTNASSSNIMRDFRISQAMAG